jgi:hypothetical protein
MTETFRDIKTHLPFVLLVVVLGVYLGIKTFPEEGWSGWKEGSAQTMLTLEHWDRDGIFEHRLLFIPIGYSSAARHIDDPGLRHHARGIVTGKLIGNRLYYTHYPPGYLLPFAALKKAGANERSSFRLLSLAVSLGALVLMYAFLNRISTPSIAFFGALYYGASTMFLDFADSLANQPIDDLLRFAILFLSISGLRAEERLKKRYTAFIWALFFILAASSYDSVIFVFLWLVGLDYVQWLKDKGKQKKPVPVKKWALYALAPVVSFALQQVQNLWYLGWSDLVLDLKGVFLYRVASGGGGGALRHLTAVFTALDLSTGISSWYSVPAIVVVGAALVYLRKHIFYRWPELSFFVLLLVAGLAYSMVFSRTSDLDYQGRQLSPALALLVGSGLVLFLRTAISPRALFNRKGGPVRAALFGLLFISLVVLVFGQARRTAEYVNDWPNHAVDPVSLNAYKALNAMTANDAVIFSVDALSNKRYPQAAPTFEYYAGKMVLSFQDPEDMMRDLKTLKGLSTEPFDVIIFTPQFETIELMLPYSRGRDVKVLGGGYYALLIEAGPVAGQ